MSKRMYSLIKIRVGFSNLKKISLVNMVMIITKSRITPQLLLNGNNREGEVHHISVVFVCIFINKTFWITTQLSTLREESIQTNVILSYKLLAAILSAVCSVIQQLPCIRPYFSYSVLCY